MTTPWTQEQIKEYQDLFDIAKDFIRKEISEIIFYLNDEAVDFSEQRNVYGKSLLSGIELIIESEKYYLGNAFFKTTYNGLNIIKDYLSNQEIPKEINPTFYPSKILNQTIIDTKIYWHKSFFGKYFVPQEITIETESNFILFSAIEVNSGEVNTEGTDELLIIENKEIAKQLNLGEFGLEKNGRKYFNNLLEIQNAEKNIA